MSEVSSGLIGDFPYSIWKYSTIDRLYGNLGAHPTGYLPASYATGMTVDEVFNELVQLAEQAYVQIEVTNGR